VNHGQSHNHWFPPSPCFPPPSSLRSGTLGSNCSIVILAPTLTLIPDHTAIGVWASMPPSPQIDRSGKLLLLLYRRNQLQRKMKQRVVNAGTFESYHYKARSLQSVSLFTSSLTGPWRSHHCPLPPTGWQGSGRHNRVVRRTH
jgi:hypothetical protein